MDLVKNILDDLHYWLQPSMYAKMKEMEQATRVNVDFEQQKQKMEAGEWEDDEGDTLIATTPEK